MTCLVGTEAEVIAANEQIDRNAGFPNDDTATWDIPAQAYGQDFWFIWMPIPDANYGDKTGAELMENVINVEQQEFQQDWLPATVGP